MPFLALFCVRDAGAVFSPAPPALRQPVSTPRIVSPRKLVRDFSM